MSQGNTKNLGQIAAIWISSNAPTNTQLVWYDTREKVHKVYDTTYGHWIAINPQVVTNSTLSALGTIVQGGVELSIGKYYNLVDVGTLAIVISATKIWYVDTHNNYIVNDLSASIISYINSQNLLIDGTEGVWDSETGRLLFNFNEYSSGNDMSVDNDYMVFRRKDGSLWSWIKVKLKALVSTVLGNSLTWNKGLYFNFSSELDNVKDVSGGVVSYGEYIEGMNDIVSSMGDIEESVGSAITESKDYTDSQVTPTQVYGKKCDEDWAVLSNPPSVPGQDATMKDIFQILISWVNILQKADKIYLGNGFVSDGRTGNVNYTDNVRAAIEKLVYKAKQLAISNNVALPNDFNVNNYSQILPTASDSITVSIGKICKILQNIGIDVWHLTLPEDYKSVETLGEEIVKYVSGNPEDTAKLYNLTCLLCSWYDEHFNNVYRTYRGWNSNQKVRVHYVISTSGGPGEAMYRDWYTDLAFTITENSLIISNPINIPIATLYDDYDAFPADNLYSALYFDFNEDIMARLIAKYVQNGVSKIWNTNIPIYADNGIYPFTETEQRKANNVCGTLYAGIGRGRDTTNEGSVLQLAPLFIVTNRGYRNSGLKMGTKWLGDLGTDFDSASFSTIWFNIAPFTLEIPLY